MSEIMTELEKAYMDSIKELKEGEIVKGKVISVTASDVIVDVGYKSEGIIPREEFDEVSPSDEIEVYVDNVEDEEGRILLSYQKAQRNMGWKKLCDNHQEGDLIKGKVMRKVKGGYMVNVFGIEGFLPASLSAFRNMSDDEVMKGEFYFQVVKMTAAKQNFILSRKSAVRAEREILRDKVWNDIEVGQVRKGKVKSITNFGAFIDLGGIDGLLHIADMSWKKIPHPSEIVAVGDEINIMVIDFDKERGKVSLGLKQTTPDPWDEIENKYPAGSAIKGKIVNIQNYGIFVELERGIEGLVHISEISWTKKYINLSRMFAIGDTIEVKIIGIDCKGRKISLSLKQIEDDPWEDVENQVEVGSVVKGKVLGFGENCGYVELENGFEGIVECPDLSWTRKVTRAQDVVKRDQNYEFKVLGIDTRKKEIILGFKQLKENPWPAIEEKYPIGTVTEGKVVKVAPFGVFVEIEDGVEGLIFSDEIEPEVVKTLEPQSIIRVKVIKVDSEAAKIGLSANINIDEQDVSAAS